MVGGGVGVGGADAAAAASRAMVALAAVMVGEEESVRSTWLRRREREWHVAGQFSAGRSIFFFHERDTSFHVFADCGGVDITPVFFWGVWFLGFDAETERLEGRAPHTQESRKGG